MKINEYYQHDIEFGSHSCMEQLRIEQQRREVIQARLRLVGWLAMFALAAWVAWLAGA